MACTGSLSNYERKKAALINVNKWKSNFISIWEQYGTFKFVDDIRCFNYYDIDGDGAGQRRMSKHLKQPNLWADTQDDDLDWVHLVFNLSTLVTISLDGVDIWLDAYKLELEDYTFDRLVYTIVDDVVTSNSFYLDNVLIDDPFLNHLAFLIAERRNVDISNVSYDEIVIMDDVTLLMDDLASFPFGFDPLNIVFEMPLIKGEIEAYLMEQSIGTDILDQLVMDGVIIGIGNVVAGTMTYALPVDTARKMNGYAFVQMIENALDFTHKVDSHWYDFFLNIVKLVLAAVAAFFGYYYIALSLVLSFAADKTDSAILKILSAVVSLLDGDVSSLVDVGANEAVSLLMNVYGLYVELSYKPEKTVEEEVVDNDQVMFYKAPYAAYNDLYCYKNLTSVSLTSIY